MKTALAELEAPWVCYVLRCAPRHLQPTRDGLLPLLRRLRTIGVRFSMNLYTGPDPHISLRVSRRIPWLEAALRRMRSIKSIERQPYAEKREVRRAYELGTHLWLALTDHADTHAEDVIPTDDFLAHAFHGLANNTLGVSGVAEADFWIDLARRLDRVT